MGGSGSAGSRNDYQIEAVVWSGMSEASSKFLSRPILTAGIVAALFYALPAWFFLPDSSWLENLYWAEQARPVELILHPAWAGALAGRGLAGIYGSVFGAALAETLLALKMDPSQGLPAEAVARSYVQCVMGSELGVTLEPSA